CPQRAGGRGQLRGQCRAGVVGADREPARPARQPRRARPGPGRRRGAHRPARAQHAPDGHDPGRRAAADERPDERRPDTARTQGGALIARGRGRQATLPASGRAAALTSPSARLPFPTRRTAMTDAREHLLDWLRDAHAMEQQAEQMLKAQAARIENYPALKARIEVHLEETLGQQALLEACITRLGSSPSVVKDTMGKVAAMGQAIGGMVASDEIVKGSMASYVFEHMEIASYRTLIAAAQALGDVETQRACEQILAQEEAMARWLQDHLPEVTQQFLVRDETPGATAKK